ncbi:hypothetical protein [Acinetobacter sp. ANC 4470]|uniref:hypothetical protein n=1 Tax=Acinetobacter sp. ANC 4470 TaxID=1977881 RepID=UPI00117809C2|nr:hypothetical protein [Acinetobacter sp. ANC 4470]
MYKENFYRLLRKLVKEGYLYKEVNIKNHRLSLFSESEKMNEYRKNLKTKSNQYHFSELKKKTSELKAKKDFIEKQISSAKQALIDFPNLEVEINKRKIILAQELFQMNAYNTFLDSLIP